MHRSCRWMPVCVRAPDSYNRSLCFQVFFSLVVGFAKCVLRYHMQTVYQYRVFLFLHIFFIIIILYKAHINSLIWHPMAYGNLMTTLISILIFSFYLQRWFQNRKKRDIAHSIGCSWKNEPERVLLYCQ